MNVFSNFHFFFILGGTTTAEKLWPPPQPPEHLDQSSIPQNLRPSSIGRRGHGGEDSANQGQTTQGPNAQGTLSRGPTTEGASPQDSERRPAPGQGHKGQGDVPHADSGPPHARKDDQPSSPQDHSSSDRPQSAGPGHPQQHLKTGTAPSVSQSSHTNVPTDVTTEAVLPQEPGQDVTDMEQNQSPPNTQVENTDQRPVPFSADEPQVMEYHRYSNYTPGHPHLKRQRMDSGGQAMDTSHRLKEPILFHGKLSLLTTAIKECTKILLQTAQFIVGRCENVYTTILQICKCTCMCLC